MMMIMTMMCTLNIMRLKNAFRIMFLYENYIHH